MATIKFSVRGKPIPKGSKRGFVPKGWKRSIVVDANPKTKPWQTLIKMVAAEYAPAELWKGPIGLAITFWMPKPKTIPKARAGYPTTKPDLLKLCRAIEDALSGIIYKDDALVIDIGPLRKRYGPVGADVEVWEVLEPAEK